MNSLTETLKDNLFLKEKNSYTENIFKKDQELIVNILRSNGYYFSEVETIVENLDNNLVNVTHKIKLGNKNIFLVDESYNSNPLSLKSAIKNFNSIKNGMKPPF